MSTTHCLVLQRLVLSSLVLLAAARAPAAGLEVFAVSDAVRVFEDGYGMPERRDGEVRVFGISNEILSAQCVVRASEDLKDLTVAVGPLKHAHNSATIAEASIRWNFVESIFIEENTPKLRKSDLVRPAPARFPDVLSDERNCSVAKGTFKGIYLTVRIPRDARPGEYRGDVAFRSGSAEATLPLVLTVYPLALPDERHLMVTEWYSTHQFQRHHGIDPADKAAFFKMLKVYAENMAEHRQNVFQVNMELIRHTRAADGKLAFDFSDFDRWAEVFWGTGRMDLLETGFVAHFGEGGWSSREVLLRDFDVKDASTGKATRLSGKDFLPQFLPALVEHLRAKKWLDKTVLHICDEPSSHNIMGWREASDFVHRCAPELRRIDAIETTHCLDRLEIWVPKLDHLSTWQEAYEEAQRRSNELWFYTVGIFQNGSLPNKTADVPLVESRIMHWLNYRYNLKGYLHWGLNAWTEDPRGAPGKHRGDGWHVYPKKDGLLNSLRWEQMRNGIQDYECLWVLENKIAGTKAKLSPRVAEMIEPRRRGVEIASQVVRTYSDYTRDPEVLYAARRQAMEETLALDASPRVILQTNPLEQSAVANNCAIDVHGWAEPGSRIKVNGRETPVAPDGLFLVQTPPSRKGTILVEAENGPAKQTLVRTFRLQYEPDLR
ncbi:MAG: DUF4091 domain-containing protein [Pirellulales bacterium]|nr:DUF4091 domain-containing protein [Pirellulales bacterium]